MSDELESQIRQAFDAGDLETSVSRAVQGYGAEIYGFLVATHLEGAPSDFKTMTTGIRLATSFVDKVTVDATNKGRIGGRSCRTCFAI